MTADKLIARYPRLWHMADIRNVSGIFDRGLLSTSAILSLYGVRGKARAAIEAQRRPAEVALKNPNLGVAVIRDQKPLSAARIQASLSGSTIEEYLRFLNGHVFFWPTLERLITMNSARAYRDTNQLVLLLSTASLTTAHRPRIRLSPINSGATQPFAWPRSIEMFRSIASFDYEARKSRPNPIAELLVADRVTDIFQHVEEIQVWRGGERQRTLRTPYEKGSVVRRLSGLR